MTTWLWILAAIGIVLLLLVARGMYLIGQGSEAELQARQQSPAGGVASSGWALLDRLRDGDLPVVSAVEARLYRTDETETEADDK